jgi:hypothetical protein
MGKGKFMVSVRILGALGFTLAAMTGGAQASSILVLGASTSTPSVVRLGSPEPVKIAASTTPSIVALGDPLPDVTDEKVAAIPEKPKHKSGSMQPPMIIRGGVVGGAFASPAAPAKAETAAAPAAGVKPAADTKPAGEATAANDKPQPETQSQPQPAVQPATPPGPSAEKPM